MSAYRPGVRPHSARLYPKWIGRKVATLAYLSRTIRRKARYEALQRVKQFSCYQVNRLVPELHTCTPRYTDDAGFRGGNNFSRQPRNSIFCAARALGDVTGCNECATDSGRCNADRKYRSDRRDPLKPIEHCRKIDISCLALAGTALRVLQLRLARLHFLALRFADEERAAADIFRLVKFIVCQCLSPDLLREGSFPRCIELSL